MGLFGFKQLPTPHPVSPPPKVCNHKWTDIKDADGNEMWYLNFDIDNDGVLRYRIIEPYICIHCKERKDVVLEDNRIRLTSNRKCWEHIEELRELYPQIKERAIVEDAVHDFQLIDRNYLRIAAQVMGVKL